MMKHLLLCLGLFTLLISCKKNETNTSAPAQALVSQKINELYSQYGTSNDALYNKPFSDDLFSPELKKALEHAINASKEDIEKVKNSDHPDEKPLLFEGAVFSSLYEGYSSYTIKSVKIDPSGTSADANVHFEYTSSPPKVIWTDKIHLINNGKGWRIDNIRFDSIGNAKDLKANLREFAESKK
ncbi:hypothetical protein ACKW6Q_04580 [Chryseobacterium kwangjuense]|uniref:DUF3828 domain-containing protein n=1 Tax=Chryseobacterium kwangjuense TaxID=267125 RepID=A0ABW9JYT1_9FLAO